MSSPSCSLVIDSSHSLHLMLVNKQFDLVDREYVSEKKSASKIHLFIDDLLKRNNLEVESIDQIFKLAGPGSYTGIRLGEVFGQVFEWLGTNCYSFYHFQVPIWLEEREGFWVSNAFKGELFYYDIEKNKSGLVENKELGKIVGKCQKLYTHYQSSLNEKVKELYFFEETSDLFMKNLPSILKKVVENKSRVEPFYYRPLDKEFTPSFKF